LNKLIAFTAESLPKAAYSHLQGQTASLCKKSVDFCNDMSQAFAKNSVALSVIFSGFPRQYSEELSCNDKPQTDITRLFNCGKEHYFLLLYIMIIHSKEKSKQLRRL